MLYFCISSIKTNQMWKKVHLFMDQWQLVKSSRKFSAILEFFLGPTFPHFSMPCRYFMNQLMVMHSHIGLHSMTLTCKIRSIVLYSTWVTLMYGYLHQGRIQPLERGGAQIVDQWRGFQGAGPLAGVQGAEPPGGGCKGAEPPCVGKFWISELNSRDLVHTFCQHHIENLLIYFQ